MEIRAVLVVIRMSRSGHVSTVVGTVGRSLPVSVGRQVVSRSGGGGIWRPPEVSLVVSSFSSHGKSITPSLPHAMLQKQEKSRLRLRPAAASQDFTLKHPKMKESTNQIAIEALSQSPLVHSRHLDLTRRALRDPEPRN